MANYANQKRITVAAREKRDKTHPYGMYNIEALQQAMANIKTVGGIKIWCYINKNQDLFTFDLSRQELLNSWGLTRATYDSGIEELISLGYLTPIGDSDNVLLFHEVVCAENQHKTANSAENQHKTANSAENQHETANSAENQHEKTTEVLCAENKQNKLNSDENQQNIADCAENKHNWNINGFYF